VTKERKQKAVIFPLSVKELVSFVHRRGNLVGESGFRGVDRAKEGVRGHRRVQKARGGDYDSEVALEWRECRDGVETVIHGRADGVMAGSNPPLVEEIKTVDRFWNGKAEPLHLAQLKIYGAILATQRGWEEVELRLTHWHLGTGAEFHTVLRETRESLEAFLRQTLDVWFEWILPEARRRTRRDASVEKLEFPFSFRGGQRELSRRAYRAIRDGHHLFAEAPTGLGKTLAVLFPALKALPLLGEGRVFYLTAKTPGRLAAEEALRKLESAGAEFRSVTLTAKNKICFSEDPGGCDPRSCPYAVGYYDRAREAMKELSQFTMIGREQIEDVARRHTVCPHELSLDISDWCDVVIGDFNHAFDPSARLQRHFGEDASAKHVLLVDEAHNLVERSREMHSAALSVADLEIRPGAQRAKGSAKAKRALRQAAEALLDFVGKAASQEPSVPRQAHHENKIALKALPKELVEPCRAAREALEAVLISLAPGTPLSGWIEPWFALSDWLGAVDAYDESCHTICSPAGTVRIFCADPSERLRSDLKKVRSAVFFSATLSPLEYFHDLLGGGAEDDSIQLDSPFSSKQVSLRVLPLELTLRFREQTLPAVAEAVAENIRARPGNHLVFCPSHSYLAALREILESLIGGIPLALQTSAMDEKARTDFLANFTRATNTTGLAVLGGVFSEGIDLPGERLVGVCVIGTGLPSLSIERDILRRHFESTHGRGYDYAYLFPGMQRVLQAAGRLIRSTSDTGSILLIDRRFAEPRQRALLPAWWSGRPPVA